MSLARTCRISGEEFTITDQEIALLEKISPMIGGERFLIPLPTLCPRERRRVRLQFKNYFTLFKRVDEMGRKIVSMYHPESDRVVVSQEYWWSDRWSPFDYGMPYDSHKNIFEHIGKIYATVPLPALDNAYTELENSDYVNGNGRSKDCYLVSNGNENEKCLYSWFCFRNSNILNANYITECENCSHSEHLWKCYNIHFSWDTSSCRDGRYLFSCQGCQYILGGVGLKNQKYQILNSACTEEEYQNTLEKINTDAHFRGDFQKKVQALIQKIGLEEHILTGSVDSTGDFCYDSKNSYECYNVGNCDNVMYIHNSYDVSDTLDFDQWGASLVHSYNDIDCGENSTHIYFCSSVWDGAKFCFYSTKCQSCSYIFGCSGLRNQSYCIFNKQYTKEEWEDVVKQIIKQMQKEGTWGKFLDPAYSHFAYDESQAMEMLPLSREDVEKLGFHWSDREEAIPEGITKVIPGERLPENISEVPDDVLSWAIKCPKTGKYFQIQPLELEMHRRFSTPIPKIHPIERIKLRLGWDKREFSFDF